MEGIIEWTSQKDKSKIIKFIFSFANDEKQWMERLLKRQKLDSEAQANIVLLQEDASLQMRPRQLFASGYPGWDLPS